MADAEQLKILEQGVAAWNAWRETNEEVLPDLSGADLHGTNFTNAIFLDVNFREADLREANLRKTNLHGANLHEANLHGANLRGADLRRANLRGADLRFADLSFADLSFADLCMTDLSMADLSEADLSIADLHRADLSETDLRMANLSFADLSGANFNYTTIGNTVFASVDLSEVSGLDTVKYIAPSTIGIDTLYRSGGGIPEAFLRGCGVPDLFIEYLPSLLGAEEPIKYYSCFISYSHQDEEFAQRLHSRLRDNHLRVWYAPEDMRGGMKLHDQIDQAIHLHDKLLLVLSEQSIASEWVITELSRALKAERKTNRQKFFPIRLVDFATLQAWECFDDTGKDLAVEVRKYFIRDFSQWKDYDAFEAAFARLLQDLQESA